MPYVMLFLILIWNSFPGLARNTASQRRKAEDLNANRISLDEYYVADSMKRNQLSNIALCLQVGVIPICAVIIGIMYALHVDDSTENNNWGLSVLVAFASGVWLLLAMPWFVVEKRRPGQKVPPGKNIITAGFWQLSRAWIYVWKLRQSFYFLIGMTFSSCLEEPQTDEQSRLFLARRLSQHHCRRCIDSAKRGDVLQHH